MSRWLVVLFSSYISLMFCLVILTIIENGVLKSPDIIVELFISSFTFISFRFMYFGALLLNTFAETGLLKYCDNSGNHILPPLESSFIVIFVIAAVCLLTFLD